MTTYQLASHFKLYSHYFFKQLPYKQAGKIYKVYNIQFHTDVIIKYLSPPAHLQWNISCFGLSTKAEILKDKDKET